MNGGYCFSLRYKLPSRAVSGHELSLSSNIISKDMPDTLVMGGVVGDVLDCFEPDTSFRVVYSRNRPLFNGVDLRPSAVSIPPRVHLGSDLRRLFAVVSHIKMQRFKNLQYFWKSYLSSFLLFLEVLVDADYPSPSRSTRREYLHWYACASSFPSNSTVEPPLTDETRNFPAQVGDGHPRFNRLVLWSVFSNN